MKKERSIKQRLVSSILALVMLFTSLVGTTFAWFTDSVTSAGNKIQTGTLKVDLLHKVDDDWISVKENPEHKIFDYKKWEPGYTRVETLKVANNGSLALQYKLSVEVADGTATTGKNGENLADVIDVYITYADTNETSYSDITSSTDWVRKGTLAEVMRNPSAFIGGELLPTGQVLNGTEAATTVVGSQTVKIALHMQESAGNEYQELKVGDIYVNLIAAQWDREMDSFGGGYDAGAIFPELNISGIYVDVTTSGGIVTEEATVNGIGISAIIPVGVAVEGNTNKLGLSVKEKDQSIANVTLNDGEALRPLDVHMAGVSKNNTVPMIITVEKAMKPGLNIGNYTIYHVEDGTTVAMTAVGSMADLDAHNEFYYDPATGDVVLAMATFSEVAMVAEQPKWEGNRDYSWYTNAVAPIAEGDPDYVIANADQLAALSAIVGGMDGQTKNSFAGKTVKLIADINLGDEESENNPNIIFYPIGYYNSEGTYERTNTAITSGLRNFEGTFDGNGHTVSNFYHNTWEMKGDHDWYSPEEQYYRDGMGLFGRVYKGTIKNLTVKNFSSDGEIATTGVIAAYADGATFENIAIFNCNPRVYNIGNGGIVGCVGWYAKEANLKTTFKNITVDNSNKISALWGSYDVACGGIVGQYYPTSGQTSAGTPANGGLHFDNCHISAVMDVYNDVCANYQYYAYRYTGMLIGSVRENVTVNGHSYPKMDGITAKDSTVHFGTWNDYYYCEIIDNTTASYTHDYQMSRLTEIKAIDGTTITYLDGTTGTVPASGRANYVIVDYTKGHGTENATCYHFKDGKVWTHDMGGIQTGIDENGDGKDDLKEDKQHIYLEFNNLVTGYGWGVTTKGVGDLAGVTILDREVGNSVEKFEGKVTELANNKTIKLGDIFNFVDNGVELVPDAISVAVNNLEKNNPVSATINYDRKNWENSTITFTGTGKVTITIQDYYFCTPTTIEVTIKDRQPEEKFDVIFNNGDFLHRVGNTGTVSIDKLFKAKGGVSVGTIKVEISTVDGTSASGTYSNNVIQFSGTGVVKVRIADNDYCTPTELYLEVVDATNVTGLSGTISGNVVLLNDCGLSSLTVSGRNTVYGNGFTATYSGNGQYLNNGLKKGVVTVSENGTLDNLRIVAPIYPNAYLYYGKTTLGEYVQGGPSSTEGDKTRYHYQLSAVAASGNATISNCYIYGGRTNIFVDTGNVTIKDTVLECGTVANVQIQSNESHTITLEDVTTIQYQVNATIDDTSKVMLGAGVIVGPETTENPTIVLNGDFKQYNWVNADNKDAVSSETTQMIINGALKEESYNHTVNGKTASNLGIIFMNTNTNEKTIENNTNLPYKWGNVTMSIGGASGASGKVYSLQGATASQIYSDYENADRTTVNGLYQPQYKYPADLGGQYIEKDSGDEHLYREGDTIHVLFSSGDTKEIDLAKLVDITKYSGQDLKLEIVCKDENGNAIAVNGVKVSLSAAGKYTVTYTVTDALFYDKDGNTITKSVKYSWNVTIDVSLKDTKIPDARFEFDATKQKMGYYKPTIGDVKQYIPFLAGLKIYDYNGQTEYLRFDGSSDFNKVASVTITGYSSNKALVEIKLTDGGVINTQFLARANSGGASTYTGKIKTSNNTIYFVNDGGTSNKDTTTTAAYWYVDYYKFTGNNGVAIQSGQQTFNSTGSSASTPSGNFSTSIKYTVTYDANGGNCGQTTGYATSASAAVTLPTPSRSGYIFAGWYTAASGGTRVGGAGENYTPSANITLYAQWGKPCDVTYNANGGTCGTASEKYSGTALTLPTPTRDGYWFIGWYDAAEGGNKIGDAGAKYNPAKEITLYAHWQEAIEYTVTYNANGGSCGTASEKYTGTSLTLPTPSRTGYKFLGWYTAASGGTKIGDAGATYTPSANITLYAQWQINSYTITVTTSNATVKVNGTTVNNNGTISIQYGAQVTVEVTYSQSNSRSTTIKGTDGTTYTSPFAMPAQNVTINATSSGSCFTADTLITLADGTQKRIDELLPTDKVLAWDFFTGTYVESDITYMVNHGEDLHKVANLEFSDGTTLRIIADHGVFDYDLNKFVYLTVENMSEYIGHRFVKYAENDTYDIVTLARAYETEEYIEAWSITTAFTCNAFASNMLTVAPPEDFYNWIEMDGKLHYDVEQFQQDVETYGLYTYEDFADYITYEQFVEWNGAYLKIAVEKGYFTFEYILELIEMYLNI